MNNSSTSLPTVSVVIPAYNEEKLLPHTLESLKKQTQSPQEVIVVDNNSTDRTAAIAKEYGVSLLSVKKQGYVYALNEGMKHAKGEIIAVTDADTIVFPSWVEEIVKTFKDNHVVGLTGSVRHPASNLFARIFDKFYSLFLILNFSLRKPHLIGFNFAVRKTAFEKIDGLDERFTMSPDVDLGMRLKTVGKVIYNRNVKVILSMRRSNERPLQTVVEYAKGYFYTIWFRSPPPVNQTIVR